MGSGLGAAGFAVFDDSACMVKAAQLYSRFLSIESCAQCPACKFGTGEVTALLARIEDEGASEQDVETILVRARGSTDGQKCALPTGESLLIQSLVQVFGDDFRRHAGGVCPFPRELAFHKIVDWDATTERFLYDEDYASRQPDWTYDDLTVGQRRYSGWSLGYSIRALRRHPGRDREHAARGHARACPRSPAFACGRSSRATTPPGSTKDRIAKKMIEVAEASGELTPDRTILEPTSGNTGIALAMVAARKGYQLTVVIPDNASQERIGLLRLFGAEIVFSDGDKGTNGSIEVARGWRRTPSTSCRSSTGTRPTRWRTTRARRSRSWRTSPAITHFVAGMGTGGTLTGNGRRLHEHDPDIQVIAAEPELGDLVYGLRSLDEGFVPPIFDPDEVNRKFLVNSSDALRANSELTAREGIFAGISSGAVVHVARRIASELDAADIVCLLPDGGWKYLSTEAWAADIDDGREGRRGVALVVATS